MLNDLKINNNAAKIATVLFLLLSLWWVSIKLFFQSPTQNEIFGATYGVMALFGAIYGISASQKWGGIKSLMGKSILFFALGLLAQVFGQVAYSYYTYFLHIEVPYPSVGDIGYFGSIPLYILGVYYLANATGAKFSLKSVQNKFLAVLIPLVLLIASYLFFLQGYPVSDVPPLTMFLDFGYPFGQAIYISLAILTYLFSYKFLGGVMKNKVLFLLLALTVQFVADYTFLYLAYYGELGPGTFNDYLYLLSYFLMSLALIQLKTVSDDLKATNKKQSTSSTKK